MPVRIADLKRRTKALAFDYEIEDGVTETVNLTYSIGGFTGHLEAEIRQLAGDEQRQVDLLTTFLGQILTSWDVQGDGGETYPTTKEALLSLSSVFLMAVFNAILGDMRLGESSAVS